MVPRENPNYFECDLHFLWCSILYHGNLARKLQKKMSTCIAGCNRHAGFDLSLQMGVLHYQSLWLDVALAPNLASPHWRPATELLVDHLIDQSSAVKISASHIWDGHLISISTDEKWQNISLRFTKYYFTLCTIHSFQESFPENPLIFFLHPNIPTCFVTIHQPGGAQRGDGLPAQFWCQRRCWRSATCGHHWKMMGKSRDISINIVSFQYINKIN
jgi:hypothetical protein